VRYRSLDVSVVQEIAATLIDGHRAVIESRADDVGEGPSLDEQPLRDIVASFEDELADGDPGDREIFEGRLAAAVYPWLAQIPIEVLDDRGFWRYLAVRHFWWFIAWREADPIGRGNYLPLVDARSPAEQIPLRLFLRAKAVDHDGDVAIAGEIAQSTDFWRSHITRVRVASAPAMARAFAETKRDEKFLDSPLKTERLRRVAKRVNRMWSNVRLDMYDSVESKKLMKEIVENEP